MLSLPTDDGHSPSHHAWAPLPPEDGELPRWDSTDSGLSPPSSAAAAAAADSTHTPPSATSVAAAAAAAGAEKRAAAARAAAAAGVAAEAAEAAAAARVAAAAAAAPPAPGAGLTGGARKLSAVELETLEAEVAKLVGGGGGLPAAGRILVV